MTKNIFSFSLSLIMQWSLCQVSVATPGAPPAIPAPISCWVSCSLIKRVPSKPPVWTLSVIGGCTGEQVCMVNSFAAICPHKDKQDKVTAGICQPGTYTPLKPVFMLPNVGNTAKMSCGEFGAIWSRQFKNFPPKSTISGVTSVRKKDCPYSEYRRRVGGWGSGWNNDRAWDPEGCVRTEIPTNDHKAPAGQDDNVCCLRQCPQDRWRMLLPEK